MVVLIQKLTHFLKIPSKPEKRRSSYTAVDHQPSLTEFWSGVSSFLNQIQSDHTEEPPETEFWTLGRVQSFLEALSLIHKYFEKTAASDLAQPAGGGGCSWGEEITEEYLNYSFDLLGLLNCVSSSLSHLNQASVSLSIGLSRSDVSAKHLRKIQPLDLQGNFKVSGMKQESADYTDKKERVIHEAMKITKGVSLWILGAVLSALCSDIRPYLELRKSALEPSGHDEPLLLGLDCRFNQEVMEKKHYVVKEVEEINKAVEAMLAAAAAGEDVAGELGKQIQLFEERLNGISQQIDYLFLEVLAARNRVVDGLRLTGNN
ncbi:unnamed protein product [Cuscuta epithymum]|uniref:Uncharacterized protein n=1 Tax=Cuscuta epithymum TaxID=186058 RepID=A0AAV0DGD4_9ASTE|nr:unnamed protein product [Cuscuta epithymum]CAH9127139.1 unnamed protein product [Cuscuta epithymum]